MFAWLSDKLSRHVAAWITEWDASSTERKRLSYPAHERMLRWAGESPVGFLTLVLMMCLAIGIASAWAAPKYLGIHLITAHWREGEFLTYFGTLWTVQATIAAVVYPVVIAFVAVLFQRRTTAKLSLRLYAIDAAVIPAGSSALALVAWMGVQYVSLPYVSTEWVAAAMLGNSAWFLFNTSLTAWFLFRTVRFLDDEARSQVFERFAIHVALLREMREHLSGLIFSNAQANKLLPGGDYTSQNRGPKLLLFPISEGTTCITAQVPGERTVADIRLRLLRWGILLWLRQANRAVATAGLAPTRYQDPVLAIPITPGQVVEGKLDLCRVRHGPVPGRLAAFLIRHSVVLARPRALGTSYSTSEILEELAVDAFELSERHRFEAAAETMRALVDLHAALIRSGAFINSAGQSDNAALLPDPYGFGSRQLHEHWLDVYRPLAETAVRHLATDPTLYRRHCYLSFQLINSIRADHLDILIYALHISTYLMYRLGLWWADKLEDRGVLRHDPQHGAMLAPPLSGVYDRALQHFVGAWEELGLTYSDVEATTADEVWSAHARYARYIAAQANETVHMLLSAVLRGDTAASLWLADSYLKWWNRIEHHYNEQGPSLEHRAMLLNLTSAKTSWADVCNLLRDVPEHFQNRVQPRSVVAMISRRYWTDLRLVVICILLDWTSATASPEALSFEVAVALILGKNLKQGGQVDADKLLNPASILFQLLRIQLASKDYARILDKVVERAQELRNPDMVAGRMHSFSGANDVASLCLAQAQMLSATTATEVTTSPTIEAAMQVWSDDLGKLGELKRSLNQLEDCVSGDAFKQKFSITVEVRTTLGLKDNLVEAQEWTSAMLKRFANIADETQNKILREAVVSEEILNELGNAVSDYVTGPDNDVFPFSLKPRLEPHALDGDTQSLNVNGVSKIRFTNLQPKAESALWIREHIAEAIGRSIVVNYIRSTGVPPIAGGSEAEFFSDMDNQAKRLCSEGESPLLLVPTGHAPNWVQPWTYQGQAADQVRNPSFQPRGPEDTPTLIGVVNGVRAHNIPFSGKECYVVPTAHFAKLKYAPKNGGSCVSVSHSDLGDNTLQLKFGWLFVTVAMPPL